MIASHKLRTHFPTSNCPLPKKETSAYQDQNNYSFSSKKTPRQLQTTQPIKEIKNNFIKTIKDPTLISKEQNIKSIDDRIQAIMKKHAAQKDMFQGSITTKQNIQSHHQTKSQYDTKKFEKTKPEDYEIPKPNSKKHSEVPQSRQSQVFNKRNYASANKEAKYSTNKDVSSNQIDEKIKLLNDRIMKAEQQKKKLNIKFTPFQWQNNAPAQLKGAKQLISVIQRSRKRSILKQPVLPPEPIIIQPLQMKNQPLGRIKRQKSTNEVKPRFKEIPNNTQKTKLDQKEKAFPLEKSKKILSQLVEALVQQIKLDQTLRNLKIWFTFCNQKGKWQALKQKLAQKRKQLSLKQLKEIFQSSIEEHNPFFKWDTINCDQGLESLIQAYEKSEKHWKSSIHKRWSKYALENAGIRRQLQYDSKSDLIAEQDLVRFINLQKDAFFRNRDVYLIYRRLRGENSKLSYQALMEMITGLQQ